MRCQAFALIPVAPVFASALQTQPIQMIPLHLQSCFSDPLSFSGGCFAATGPPLAVLPLAATRESILRVIPILLALRHESHRHEIRASQNHRSAPQLRSPSHLHLQGAALKDAQDCSKCAGDAPSCLKSLSLKLPLVLGDRRSILFRTAPFPL